MVAKKKEEIRVIEPEQTQVPNPSFYANEFTYHVGGRDVFLDFKNISPRFNKNIPVQDLIKIYHQKLQSIMLLF